MEQRIDRDRIARAICSATDDVFTTMVRVKPEAGQPYVEKDGSQRFNGVISLVGMAGAWVGAGSLSCSADAACDLSSRLLLGESHTVDQEVLDALGELTNMVIGNFKNAMEESLGPMGLSIPTVICGHDFRAHNMGGQDWTVVPFTVAGNRLDVKVCLAPHESGCRAGSR